MDFFEVFKNIIDFISAVMEFFANPNASVLQHIKTIFPEAISKILTSTDFEKMYNVMIPVGIGLAVVYTSLDLIEKASIEMITPDKIFLTMAKLVIALAFVNNGIIVFQGLNGVSERMVELMEGALGVQNLNLMNGITEPEMGTLAGGIFEAIIFIFKLLNPLTFLAGIEHIFSIFLIAILIPVAAYQRAIKIGYYCIAAPLVLSDTAGRGLRNSHSLNFIFGLLRAFMEYPVIWFGIMLLSYIDGLLFSPLSFVILTTTILFKANGYIKTLI